MKKFLNRYDVSENGKIFLNERELKPFDNNSMNHSFYKRIKLICEDGKRRAFYVHRIVASLYLGSVEGMHVDHLDGDTKNNEVENLMILLPSENFDKRVFIKRRN